MPHDDDSSSLLEPKRPVLFVEDNSLAHRAGLRVFIDRDPLTQDVKQDARPVLRLVGGDDEHSYAEDLGELTTSSFAPGTQDSCALLTFELFRSLADLFNAGCSLSRIRELVSTFEQRCPAEQLVYAGGQQVIDAFRSSDGLQLILMSPDKEEKTAWILQQDAFSVKTDVWGIFQQAEALRADADEKAVIDRQHL